MNLNFSTLLGVVGVALTVFFFVIGYRQTIGARKERARAANKVASDALFRRLTLEEKFETDILGVNKLLSGWATEARVRLSDMYSSEELYAVLACRIVESDYLSGDQRKEVMHRAATCFRETQNVAPPEVPHSRGSVFGTEVVLAVASATTALVTTTIAAFLADNGRLKELVTTAQLRTIVEAGSLLAGLIVLTGVALTLFTRLRETTRSTDERQLSNEALANRFEYVFASAAKRANPSIQFPGSAWPDLIYQDGDDKVAVELKYRLDASPGRLRALLNETEKRRESGGYSRVLIVSDRLPKGRSGELPRGKIELLPPSEALERITRTAQNS